MGWRVAVAALLFWVIAAGAPRLAAAESEEEEEETEPLVEIPERDDPQIAQARAVTLTRTLVPAELAGMATAVDGAMDPEARVEALRIIERFRGDAGALANAAAILWVQRSPDQSLRIAAEAAKTAPEEANALNTLAAVLTQAGYEGKAIPLLRYLAGKYTDDPVILSNLAVAWLNLGEVEEAKKVLVRCLAVAPGHGVANVAAGIIAESEGRHNAAKAHFRKATASNSSPVARSILKREGESYRGPKGFFGMLPKAEYFSPGAFEPVRPQKLLAEYELKQAEKKGYADELMKLIKEQDQMMQVDTLKLIGTLGAELPNVYAKLDWDNHIKSLNQEARLQLANERLAARILALSELRLKLDKTPTPGPIDSQVPSCVRRRPIAQAALAAMAAEYEKMVAETLFLWRDTTNERLAYLRFIQPEATYKISFMASVNAYLGFVHTLNSNLPLVADPCAGQDLQRAGKFDLVPPGAGPCPFSIDFDAMVATLHMDCHSFGFDFQAGLACSVTKEFVSGETTLTAGVGAKMDLGSVGKVSGSGQMVIVWDAGNDLSFVGVEAGGSAKLSGIPGLSGTLAEDTLDLGRDPGAPTEGPSITASGADLTKDLVKVGSTTRLGMEIGPRGMTPSLSGEVSGQLLGQNIFEAKIP